MRGLTRRKHLSVRDERGTVAIIVAVLLVTLLGMAAFVVDVGAVYEERRELQNGADAGALAVGEDCARGDCGAYTATAAGLVNDNADDGTSTLDGVTIDYAAQTVTVDTSTSDTVGGAEVPFTFGQVLGDSGRTVTARAVVLWGSPLTAPAVPLTVSLCEWEQHVGDPSNLPSGEVTITFHDGNATEPCNGPAGQDVPGGFGWLDEADCLAELEVDEDGVWVGSNTGVSVPGGCQLSNFPLNTPILIPIFDDAFQQGQNARFHVVGFAAFELTAFKLSPGGSWQVGSPTCQQGGLPPAGPGGGGQGGGQGGGGSDQVCITGRFVDFYEADAQTGGPLVPNFGVVTAQLIE